MNRLSIKTRITIWYTAVMLLLCAAALAFILSVGAARTKDSAISALTEVTEDAFQYIEYDDGELEIDDDLDLYRRGVYLGVYDKSGALIAGGIPSEPAAAALSPGAAYRVGEAWYVYDSHRELYGGGGVYVRGAVTVSAARSAETDMVRLALAALPVLVALAAVIGHAITARAFLPVRRITETAQRITESGDLTERIGLPPGKDEIHALAAAFDKMFGRLEDAFEKEKQFTSDASHELRTPAAVITAQSEYGLSHPEEAQGSLQTILTQAKRMNALLSQLLMLSRADSGTARLNIETLDLSELFEMVTEESAERAREADVTLHLDAGEHIMVHGDETMLMRLLINLIDNAVKYNRPGGNVWISLKKKGDTLTGTVADDGIGISDGDLAHIWERFYQADRSRRADGSGLGLPMVKWIANAHGGNVSATRREGGGSEFTFTLKA